MCHFCPSNNISIANESRGKEQLVIRPSSSLLSERPNKVGNKQGERKVCSYIIRSNFTDMRRQEVSRQGDGCQTDSLKVRLLRGKKLKGCVWECVTRGGTSLCRRQLPGNCRSSLKLLLRD